jgi:hypothetical protein
MNRQQFYQYLQNPNALDNESLKHLNELVAEYPYFQAGRMLLVKNLHLLDHIRFNHELKAAAAHIPDRKKLYLLIHEQPQTVQQPPFAQPETVEKVSMVDDSSIIEIPQDEADIANEATGIPAETVKNTQAVDYFDVSDVVDLSDGLTIDFSSSKPLFEQKEEPAPVVLPTADLLDYELQDTPAYQLDDELPEPFDPNHNRSFSDWLKAMRANPPAKAAPEPKPATSPNKQMAIIDSFLQNGRDRLVPKKDVQEEQIDIAQHSIEENDALMTETLANIHIKQKHYHKAITIFEKLSLKYPEKSIYFAARIKELERFITNL